MGTRSITYFQENGKTLTALYRQMDGYPTGHGQDILDFLGDKHMVNGYRGDGSGELNGLGCLAVQLITDLKVKHGLGPGGLYITEADADREWIDYTYYIDVLGDSQAPGDTQTIALTIFDYHGKILYEGPLAAADMAKIEASQEEE